MSHPLLEAALLALPVAQRPDGPFHAGAVAPEVDDLELVRVARWCGLMFADRARRGERARIAQIGSALDEFLATPRRLGKTTPELRALRAFGEPKAGCSAAEANLRDAATAAAWIAQEKSVGVLPRVRRAVQRAARELAVRPEPMTGAAFVEALDRRLMRAEMASLLIALGRSSEDLGEVVLRHGDRSTGLDLVVATRTTGGYALVVRARPDTWLVAVGTRTEVVATVPDVLFGWAAARL